MNKIIMLSLLSTLLFGCNTDNDKPDAVLHHGVLEKQKIINVVDGSKLESEIEQKYAQCKTESKDIENCKRECIFDDSFEKIYNVKFVTCTYNLDNQQYVLKKRIELSNVVNDIATAILLNQALKEPEVKQTIIINNTIKNDNSIEYNNTIKKVEKKQHFKVNKEHVENKYKQYQSNLVKSKDIVKQNDVISEKNVVISNNNVVQKEKIEKNQNKYKQYQSNIAQPTVVNINSIKKVDNVEKTRLTNKEINHKKEVNKKVLKYQSLQSNLIKKKTLNYSRNAVSNRSNDVKVKKHKANVVTVKAVSNNKKSGKVVPKKHK